MLKLLTVVLSFIVPGLGHLFVSFYPSAAWHSRNHQIFKRGVYFSLAFLASCILANVVIGFLFLPIVYIWGIIDSYKCAKRIF